VGDTERLEVQDDLIREVGHVQEWRLIEPLSLDEHLEQVDQFQGCLEVTLMRTYVNHTLDHTNRLIEHTFGVGDEISNRQGTPIKVSLQEKVSLGEGTLHQVLAHFEWDQVRQSLVQDLLIMTYRQALKFLTVRQNIDEFFDTRIRTDHLIQVTYRLMGQVVERGDVSLLSRDDFI